MGQNHPLRKQEKDCKKSCSAGSFIFERKPKATPSGLFKKGRKTLNFETF